MSTIPSRPKYSLMDLAGIFSHEEAEKLRKRIKESRRRSRLRMKRIAKELAE